MISAIIFDMDGLMLDTEILAINSWKKAGEHFGYIIEKELMMKAIGRTIQDTQKILEEKFGNDFPFEEARKVRFDHTRVHMEVNGIPLKKGLIEILNYCKKENIPIAVATSTNRSHAVSLLNKANIMDYFNAIVCGDDVKKGKPEPDIFIKASEELGVSPDKCIVLEDSENGILAAYRANMVPVWVPDLITESLIAKEHAKHICDSLIDVITLVESF